MYLVSKRCIFKSCIMYILYVSVVFKSCIFCVYLVSKSCIFNPIPAGGGGQFDPPL